MITKRLKRTATSILCNWLLPIMLLVLIMSLASGLASGAENSNSRAPSFSGMFEVGRLAGGPVYHVIHANGDFVYGLIYPGGILEIVDVSDPANPFVRSALDLPFSDGHDLWYGEWETHQYVFTGHRFGGIVMVDVSNPDAPTVVSTAGTIYIHKGLQSMGRYLYYSEHPAGASQGGLRIYDFGDGALTEVGNWLQAPPCAVDGRELAVRSDGNGVYQYNEWHPDWNDVLCGIPNERMRFFDTTDKSAPTVAASVPPPEPRGRDPIDWTDMVLSPDDQYLYEAHGESGVHIYDVSVPDAPNLIATVGQTLYDLSLDSGAGVLYASGGQASYEKLLVVDVRNPAAPTVMQTLEPLAAHDMWFDGGYLYVATPADKLIIYYGLDPQGGLNVPCDTNALIYAINAANADGKADTLNLAEGCHYTLTTVDNATDGYNGLPSITSEITIKGNEATVERSSAAGTPAFRIFHVEIAGNLKLSNLTLGNGWAYDDPEHVHANTGGAIFNRGAVKLTNSVVIGNNAGAGGGITNRDGVLELINCTVSNNNASSFGSYAGAGGGISNHNNATVKLINSTVSDNNASDYGGAIMNSFDGDDVSRNRVTVINSTISGNSAGSDGGGISVNDGIVELINSTITRNSADSRGGGIETIWLPNGQVTLFNTILAGNLSGGDCDGPLVSLGHNLLGNESRCDFGRVDGDQVGVDPRLSPLKNFGGPTLTHSLYPDSPAIDTGSCSGFTTDQRGQHRPEDGDGDGVAICDIGAFEFQEGETAITLLSFTAQPSTDHVTLSWQTGTEVDNAGFNILRAEAADGPYTRLNAALIPAQGDPVSGASYTYTDNDVVQGVTYYYKLEDVDIHGVSAWHGPVSATSSDIYRVYLPLVVK